METMDKDKEIEKIVRPFQKFEIDFAWGRLVPGGCPFHSLEYSRGHHTAWNMHLYLPLQMATKLPDNNNL